ncbi:MAG: C40 family peptidase, partial [Syntrophorhabdaceae bacterium]|nr:C40 family peptidase [Syntrophorhabdaceae bacterium]
IKPGDLLFISERQKYSIIHHVMLYAGGETLIEAYETGTTVREITFEKRFGMSLKDIRGNKLVIDKRRIYFCRHKAFK